MDALEPLLQRDLDILKPTDYNYTISFIGVALDVNQRVVESIKNVNRIGEELGRDFEIIVVHSPVAKDLQAIIRDLRKKCPNLVMLESHPESVGQGKSIAFEYSTGKFVVPFDTLISYPIRYSDVLHNFLRFKLKRLYYSELSLLSREIVSEVGGWRNLASGEDIDLYSRISINYGVFACPTRLLAVDDRMKRELLSIRAFPDPVAMDFNSSYKLIRDLIISCNHSFADVRNISRIHGEVEGKSWRRLFLMAYLGSKISRVKPVAYNRNNYVILMESILESLILREYLKMADVSEELFWNIDRTHIRFLKLKSKLFREMKDSTTLFLKDQI